MKLFVTLCLAVCVSLSIQAQTIKSMTADRVIKYTSSPDTVYIINFWATWCMPCIQELPEFDDLYKRYSGKPVKVLLLSLDFKQDYPYRLAAFIERMKLLPEVVWLSETNPERFVPKFDESWEGSIPATIIVAPGRNFRKFMEGAVSAGEVSAITDDLLRSPVH